MVFISGDFLSITQRCEIYFRAQKTDNLFSFKVGFILAFIISCLLCCGYNIPCHHFWVCVVIIGRITSKKYDKRDLISL